MQSVVEKVQAKYRKKQVVDVRSGDTVRVHQKIREGNKERVQVFQGLVIRTDRKNSLDSRITVRRVTGGVGVEKSFLLHSPLVVKVEVVKRSKVRRNYLSYMRQRTGKSARLSSVDFDRDTTNTVEDDKKLVEDKPSEVEAVDSEAAAQTATKSAETPVPETADKK